MAPVFAISSSFFLPFHFIHASLFLFGKPCSGRIIIKTITRSVFANDKFVKLMQDVTRERKIFEK